MLDRKPQDNLVMLSFTPSAAIVQQNSEFMGAPVEKSEPFVLPVLERDARIRDARISVIATESAARFYFRVLA
jgi:hypothetical protein